MYDIVLCILANRSIVFIKSDNGCGTINCSEFFEILERGAVREKKGRIRKEYTYDMYENDRSRVPLCTFNVVP